MRVRSLLFLLFYSQEREATDERVGERLASLGGRGRRLTHPTELADLLAREVEAREGGEAADENGWAPAVPRRLQMPHAAPSSLIESVAADSCCWPECGVNATRRLQSPGCGIG